MKTVSVTIQFKDGRGFKGTKRIRYFTEGIEYFKKILLNTSIKEVKKLMVAIINN